MHRPVIRTQLARSPEATTEKSFCIRLAVTHLCFAFAAKNGAKSSCPAPRAGLLLALIAGHRAARLRIGRILIADRIRNPYLLAVTEVALIASYVSGYISAIVNNADARQVQNFRSDGAVIEDKLGLTNQPRAIAFHTDEKTGHEHMHLAWSRIDQDTMKARPLPFFKFRLKEVSRELEIELGLTRVRNEREGLIEYAPTRAEEEQARRLGLDIHQIRQTIRDCYGRSDCGRSFEAALAHERLILAQGERRDFIVLDAEGGMHALGKRILGVTAAQTRERLSDLDRQQLPTVEQARLHICERALGREYEKQEPMPDRYREEIKWEDALARAAIEKEKRERQFVEPQQRKERQGGRNKEWSDEPKPARNDRAVRESQ